MDIFIPEPWIYYFHLPIGLMKASGYLRGDEYLILNKGTNFEYPIQNYIAGNTYWQFISVILLLLVLSYVLFKIYYIYCGLIRKKRRHYKMWILSFLVVILSGCNVNEKIHNTNNSYLTRNFLAYRNGFLFILEDDVKYYDFTTHELTSFIHAPDYKEENQLNSIMLSDQSLCYLTDDISSQSKGNEIMCYQMEDRTLSTLYSNKKDIMETKLFGLINNYHIGLEDAPNMQYISDFFVYENDLYLFESNHVMQFSLKNNEKPYYPIICKTQS